MPGDGHDDRDGVRVLVSLAQVTARLSRLEPPSLAHRGMSNSAMRVFVGVDAFPGCTPSQLADRLGMDRTAISRVLRTLDALKMVRRKTDAADRRYVRVSLTPRGQQQMQTYVESIIGALDDVATQVDAVLALFPDAADSDHVVTPALVIDRLGRGGSELVAGFIDVEREAGVTDWAQRFLLWAAVDDPTATLEQHASTLRVGVDLLRAAAAHLESVGLATLTEADRLTVSELGAGIVREHVQIVVDRGGELADAFLDGRRAITLVRAS